MEDRRGHGADLVAHVGGGHRHAGVGGVQGPDEGGGELRPAFEPPRRPPQYVHQLLDGGVTPGRGPVQPGL